VKQKLSEKQKWLSKKYLGYKFLTNIFFVGAVWLYFYRLFITDQQVGILDGFAFAIGLIAEIPSGILADKFGRDKMVKFGQFLAGSGLLIQALGSSFMPFFVGQAIMMIGVSFVSGADEALFFEKLKFDRKSVNWRKLVTRGSQVSLISLLTAAVIGGWLHNINPRIPWFLTGFSLISSVFLIWSIKDTRIREDKQKFSVEIKKYLTSIKSGFKQFGTSKLRFYIPIILSVQGLFYISGWGILRLVLLNRFHFSPFLGSLVIASNGIITVGILALMHKYAEKISEKKVISLISLLAAFSLLMSIPNIGMWGYLVIFILYAGEHTLYPFMSEIINHQVEEENERATVLSVASFLRALPYVVLAPVIGLLSTKGKLEYFFIIWAVLITFSVFLYLRAKKNDTKMSLVKDKES
jgi:MFS family permease